MKIGIIGAAGFLGTSIMKDFQREGIRYQGFDIKFSQESIQYLDVEKCSENTDLKGCKTIINLAAVHRDDIKPVRRYDDVNIEGAKNICKAASANDVNRIIFISSVAIYGFAPPGTDESGKVNYFNDYGRTKSEAEKVYINWQKEDPSKRNLIIIRPTVIFGPGNRGNVYNLLKQINSKRFAMFGNGQNIKSMAYVENVSSFIRHALSFDFDKGIEIYNYIDKPDLSMNELVTISRSTLFQRNNVGLRFPKFLGIAIGLIFDVVASLSGKKLPISSIRVKKFMATTKFNTSLDETDFVPPFTLKEGLEKTLRYEFLEDNSDKPTFETE